MANFAQCSFNNGAPLADLASYSPTGTDVGTWAKLNSGGSYNGVMATDSNGTTYLGDSGISCYINSGTPASADYSVQADMVFDSAGPITGVGGRFYWTYAPCGYYVAHKHYYGYQLYKVLNGGVTQLGSDLGHERTAAGSDTVKLTMVGGVLTVYLNGVQIGTYTDSSPLTTAGNAGFFSQGGGAGSSSTTYHWDNFLATAGSSGPSLTSPTTSSVGTTTATLGVTTDTATGTLYAVVTTSATPPSAAQIEAGQTNTGAAAAYAGSQAVSSSGAKTFSATGLTASTTYYTYFVQVDGSSNTSSVAAASSFTTSAIVAPLTAGATSFVSSGTAGILVTATNASGGTPAYSYQWQRNTDGGAYSNLSNGSGVSGATTLSLTDGSAVAGHLYGYKLVYTDSVSGTATSSPVTAQVYTGGVISGSTTVIFVG